MPKKTSASPQSKPRPCGIPVIAYGKGGALETVKDGETGCFFKEQTVESIVKDIEYFETLTTIRSLNCRSNAEKFSTIVFKDKIYQFIENKTIDLSK